MSKILVFGSINMDHVYAVPHIVKPGETISSTALSLNWGGKGLNQAIALAKAGAEVTLAGKVNRGDLEKLHELGADFHLGTDKVFGSSAPTGHAIIQVDEHGQNSIVIFAGANGDIGGADVSQAMAQLQAGDLVLLQNEISGTVDIIRKAKEIGASVALNPSPFREEILNWPLESLDYLLLNEVEAAQMTGISDPMQALDRLTAQYPKMKILMTLGGEGSCYGCGDVRVRAAAELVDIVDTTAAGDTYTGYILTELQAGVPVEAAMQTASKAAGICVSRPGAVRAIPWRAEVLK